ETPSRPVVPTCSCLRSHGPDSIRDPDRLYTLRIRCRDRAHWLRQLAEGWGFGFRPPVGGSDFGFFI
ncbi:MAG: hypothetical protein AAB562_03095, partial [Patescibacteria group bacterium]